MQAVKELPPRSPHKAMYQHATTLTLGLIDKFKTLVKMLSYVNIYSVHDYLDYRKGYGKN